VNEQLPAGVLLDIENHFQYQELLPFMRRSHLMFPFLALATSCGGEPPMDPELIIVREDPTDLPLRDISDELRVRFDEGDALFEQIFRPTQGLGPLYIRHACGSCHEDDRKGPGSVTKMVLVDVDGAPLLDQSALPYGHTKRDLLTAPATLPIAPPDDVSVKVSKRFGPAVFGRGYIEAIADEEIERVEAEQAKRGDAITGRINRVVRHSLKNDGDLLFQHERGEGELIGRFGLKARIASIDDFTADAFQGDMGITSPLRPDELMNPEGLLDDAKVGLDVTLETVNAVTDYVRLLDIPRREKLSEDGRAAFAAADCAVCHVPSMRTRGEHFAEALRDIDAEIYSDLLLHDMGDALADGLNDESATWREWRTAPLMGLRHLRNFLHDGRAKTLEEAIELHEGPGSEANDSVARYRALSADDRTALLEFVSRL
jgi:CxxC motif-containing protein (DUF1111 family)